MTAPSPWPPHAWRVAAAAACVPKPRMSVSAWAEGYRVVPPPSPAPGRWHNDLCPFLTGIMDALSEPGVDTIAIMMASQLGKTEVMLNILGYFVDQDPASILLVQPTIEAVEAFSKERIDPSFRASPVLRGKLEDGKDGRGASRKSGQTIRLKMFPGGYLAMSGANAPSGLASRPIRVVLCDEIDRFPASTGVDGDPIAQAFQRTSNFEFNRKRVLVSTPSVDGISKIQTWHAKGDQRQYLVPCPHCGARQVLRWGRLRWQDAAGQYDPAQIRYQCEVCGAPIKERCKPEMVAAGQWVAQVPGGKNRSGKIVSFGDLSALYSPWVSWRALVEEWLAAQESRDRTKLREFVNLREGLPFVEHEHVTTAEALQQLRESYGAPGRPAVAPEGVLRVTVGVDAQGNRLEAEAVGWGAGQESWGLQYVRLAGDPSRPEVWQQLDRFLERTWHTPDGRLLKVACCAVDSGDGNRSSHVYAYCRERAHKQVWAVKGKGGDGYPIIISGKPTWPNGVGGAALYTIGVNEVKATLLDRLQLDEPGPGYCHLPTEPERGYDQDWFDELVAERQIPITRGGKTRLEWYLPRGLRNEALDCRVYATAALEIIGGDLDGNASAYSWL